MEELLPHIEIFSRLGQVLLLAILVLSIGCGLSGLVNLFSKRPVWQRITGQWLLALTILFTVGFLLTCWLHLRIFQALPLELPNEFVDWLNTNLRAMNDRSTFGMPLYDPAAPPRYYLPMWIENEKYYFWFFCYAVMALIAHFRLPHSRLRGGLHVLLAIQAAILYFSVNPFVEPLPRFFAEVSPWFAGPLPAMERMGLFMQLYPRMIFYYNAHYMWFHPPMLFLAYGCITVTFVTSLFMLAKRELAVEQLGYSYAKFGYFMLTLGMLLGYPWALQAWGPNWWWDPKICSSIMMWAVFSTYLHTRLYANKKGMWYFSSCLGILCFVAMVFTFLASFFFPGEHTMQ